MTKPKRSLDVYRDAAREYHGGPSGEGIAILIAVCVCLLAWYFWRQL